MIIENIEKKIKLALFTSIGSFVSTVIIVIIMALYSYKIVENNRKNIYVIDNDIPLLAHQTSEEANFENELKSHINIFHHLFFTIPPDDKFIKSNIEKAAYLCDESLVKNYNNLNEVGFYTDIINTSACMTIQTDSIKVDLINHKFAYYGTQRIDRRTNYVKRSILTVGGYRQVLRSENNPHGIIIENWRVQQNNDIEIRTKR